MGYDKRAGLYKKDETSKNFRIKGVISIILHKMCVRALNCTVDRWFVYSNYVGGQFETLNKENSE